MRQYRTRHTLGQVSNRVAGRSQGSLTGAAGLVLRTLTAGAAGGSGQSRGRQGQEGSHESDHREIMWGGGIGGGMCENQTECTTKFEKGPQMKRGTVGIKDRIINEGQQVNVDKSLLWAMKRKLGGRDRRQEPKEGNGITSRGKQPGN